MKYFYYDYSANKSPVCRAEVVSEKKLPRPDPKFKGKCSPLSRNIPPKLKVGRVVNIAFGDPRILRGCRKLSLKRNPFPTNENTSIKKRFMVVFKFQGGRFWVDRRVICLLKDLK
jgi:hypothetical protein